MMDRVVAFFVDNMPSVRALLTGGPVSLLWAFACLGFAGYLKRRHRLRTGYTRKVFHFLIFFTAAACQVIGGSRALCLFGAMTSLVVFYAVLRGDGHILYEAIAREKDAPHRTYYIMVPYFATLIGGIAANILFGPAAAAGYLVAGWGDAVGEPAGVRFGRHTYRVPSRRSVPTCRSYEGSAAVFVASLLALAVAIAATPALSFSWHSILTVPLVAVVAALAEAVSPHGWDNATMQLVPAFLVYMVAG